MMRSLRGRTSNTPDKERRQEVEFDDSTWARAPTLTIGSKGNVRKGYSPEEDQDETATSSEYDQESYQRYYTAREPYREPDQYDYQYQERDDQEEGYEEANYPYEGENGNENEVNRVTEYEEGEEDYDDGGYNGEAELEDENTYLSNADENEEDNSKREAEFDEDSFGSTGVEEYSTDDVSPDVGDESEVQQDEDGSPDESDDNALTPYTLEKIDEQVEVRNIEGKGRCLFTKHAAEPGAIIFIEEPVLVATPSLHEELWTILAQLHEENAFELPPIWHLAALCSITMLEAEKFEMCMTKWVPDPKKAPGADVRRVLDTIDLDVDPKLYERLLQVWRFNSFGHHTESDGLILYNRISMMAHNCQASGCWHYGKNDSFVLRARCRLPVGAELTISYIGDDELFKSTEIRREKLQGWLFTCQCKRCHAPVDNARGFRCPICGTGTLYFKTEEDQTTSSPCSLCLSVPTQEVIHEFVDYEKAYADRLDDTDKSDMADAENVYNLATRVFTNHWILYQLHTKLFEGYSGGDDIDSAIFHQMERLRYALQVAPLASYVIPWLYEELADLLMRQISSDLEKADNGGPPVPAYKINRISRNLEDAYNILYIMCGENHEYTTDCLTKKNHIDKYLPEE